MILKFMNKQPQFNKDKVFLAENSTIIGDVSLSDNVNIWFNVVIRGDVSFIKIGENTNIQDNSTVHVGNDVPTIIGKNVTVGHNAIIHGCTIDDNCLIGMGATVLDGAVIGSGSIVGANALVTGNTIIPPHSLVLGSPAKVVKKMDYTKQNMYHALDYVELSKKYMS